MFFKESENALSATNPEYNPDRFYYNRIARNTVYILYTDEIPLPDEIPMQPCELFGQGE